MDKFALARDNERLRLQLRTTQERVGVKDQALSVVLTYINNIAIPAEDGAPPIASDPGPGGGQVASNGPEAAQVAEAGLSA